MKIRTKGGHVCYLVLDQGLLELNLSCICTYVVYICICSMRYQGREGAAKSNIHVTRKP